MMKKLICVLLSLCLLITLTGCSGIETRPDRAAATLVPAGTNLAAPDGEHGSGNNGTYALYLPSKDGLNLLAQYITLQTQNTEQTAETLVRRLLVFDGNDQVNAIGGDAGVTLYGTNPVEVSGGVCTVNLSSSALLLDYQDIYTLSLAIAATLCELEQISYVNVLSADQAIGTDITGNLPMGSLNARPGEDLPVLWEQLQAKKTPLGRDLSLNPFSSLCTLYFPLADGSGIIPETRTVSFAGQTPQQMTSSLLDALSFGALYQQDVPAIPDLNSLMTHAPLSSELEDGGRLITLTFRDDLERVLAGNGIDMACMIAGVTYTLTSFIPGIAALNIRVGETLLTSLYSKQFGSVLFRGGLQKRNQFEPYLMGQATLYFRSGDRLMSIRRAFPGEQVESPGAHLQALLEGPTESETAEGASAVMPAGLSDEDILGIEVCDGVVTVNLTESFRQAIADYGAENEQLLCYSMVNTLCSNTGCRSVCFFFEGEQAEMIAGTVCWSGEFLYAPGLAGTDVG